jgi:hypothetical protein
MQYLADRGRGNVSLVMVEDGDARDRLLAATTTFFSAPPHVITPKCVVTGVGQLRHANDTPRSFY